MTTVARKLLDDLLALSEEDRLDIASAMIASVDGPADADWDAAWLAELDRRLAAATARSTEPPEWSEVGARVLPPSQGPGEVAGTGLRT
jgi:putative addiction module component (TIGR02574 family)